MGDLYTLKAEEAVLDDRQIRSGVTPADSGGTIGSCNVGCRTAFDTVNIQCIRFVAVTCTAAWQPAVQSLELPVVACSADLASMVLSEQRLQASVKSLQVWHAQHRGTMVEQTAHNLRLKFSSLYHHVLSLVHDAPITAFANAPHGTCTCREHCSRYIVATV